MSTGGEEESATREFVVTAIEDVQVPLPADGERLAAYASSRGGDVLPMSEADALGARIAAAVQPPVNDVDARPMRSPYWILPFAGLLIVEWWSRRRGGLR
jgi:hypothetical protein